MSKAERARRHTALRKLGFIPERVEAITMQGGRAFTEKVETLICTSGAFRRQLAWLIENCPDLKIVSIKDV